MKVVAGLGKGAGLAAGAGKKLINAAGGNKIPMLQDTMKLLGKIDYSKLPVIKQRLIKEYHTELTKYNAKVHDSNAKLNDLKKEFSDLITDLNILYVTMSNDQMTYEFSNTTAYKVIAQFESLVGSIGPTGYKSIKMSTDIEGKTKYTKKISEAKKMELLLINEIRKHGALEKEKLSKTTSKLQQLTK